MSAVYSALPPDVAQRNAAELRIRRLNKPKNLWWMGMLMDLIFGAGPWVIGSAVVAAALTAIFKEVEGAVATFALFNAPVAIAAIASFSAFLLVGKQSTNLGNNAKIIGEYGNLSGSLVNIALFVKSQIASGKSSEFLTLQDGAGSTFQTTRIGLVCSSVCYVVKYTGRGAPIRPEGLPLGQDPKLLRAYGVLTSPSMGAPGMTPFAACILLIGELVDELSTGERTSEYAVLFQQINAVTTAEGAIMGTAGYATPYIMKWLLFTLQILYLLLLLMTDLVPHNEWNSVWIVAIFSFCTVGFWFVSERCMCILNLNQCRVNEYMFKTHSNVFCVFVPDGNPMKLRSRAMGQKPYISNTCVDTEIAITSIFARAKSPLAAFGGDSNALATGIKLTLGGNGRV